MTAIGVTGTRRGATVPQLVEMRSLIEYYITKDREGGGTLTRLHHGDCVGVDLQAHGLALELGALVEVHPPLRDRYRAYTTHWSVLHKEAEYEMRNRHIVEACDVLIGVPEREQNMSARSGTWATIRMARRIGKPVHIVRAGRW